MGRRGAAELRRGAAGGSVAVAEGRLGRRGRWLAAPCSYDFVMPPTTCRVVGTKSWRLRHHEVVRGFLCFEGDAC